jgi:hypothetical protein
MPSWWRSISHWGMFALLSLPPVHAKNAKQSCNTRSTQKELPLMNGCEPPSYNVEIVPSATLRKRRKRLWQRLRKAQGK